MRCAIFSSAIACDERPYAGLGGATFEIPLTATGSCEYQRRVRRCGLWLPPQRRRPDASRRSLRRTAKKSGRSESRVKEVSNMAAKKKAAKKPAAKKKAAKKK